MGITTDFVIVDAAQAKAVLAEPAPTRRWPGVEAKSVDIICLSTLASIVAGKSVETESVVAYSKKFQFLASTSDNERHVLLLPDDLVRGLAQVKDVDLPSVARAWHSTAELRSWKEQEVSQVLRELRDLAREAVRVRKPVLLQWGL
jgi:hypothetical protein